MSDPLIVETDDPLSVEVDGCCVPPLPTDGLVGMEDEEDAVLSVVRVVDTELRLLDTESPELMDKFSVRIGKPVVSGGTTLTTLIPWPVIPLAGINSVVEPSLRFSEVRSG